MQDNYKEVTIVVIAGAILFTVFAGVIIFFLFLNQKKKFRHAQDILSIREKLKAEMLSTQLEIQEQTFNHISQEIHDNVGQMLSLAKVQISIMNERKETNPDLLNEVKQNIGKAMTDLRDIAKSLNSERIRTMSLHAAAAIEAERINKSGIVHIIVEVIGEEKNMHEQKKLVMFRIIQEGLQNIIKHAGASQVYIRLTYFPENLQTSIEDNGKGFNMEQVIGKITGLGLANIQTRAALTGGTASIQSEPRVGTTITVNMPYE
jgi:two-component system, NarL family, sensor kinase